MNRDDSCTVEVIPDDKGGIAVTLVVPTYEAEAARFTLRAERDNDGDWRVWIPWPDALYGVAERGKEHMSTEELFGVLDGMEVSPGGVLYLGALEAAAKPAPEHVTVPAQLVCDVVNGEVVQVTVVPSQFPETWEADSADARRAVDSSQWPALQDLPDGIKWEG